MNGTQPPNCIHHTVEGVGKTVAYCSILVASLIGNISIGVIVYRTKTMRTPINFFIVNMAMSDLLFPAFLFPYLLTNMYAGSWLIKGPLGQAFCKMIPFFAHVSITVSVQSMIFIAIDRFGAEIFPLRSPIISSKLCFSFICVIWIVAMAARSPVLFYKRVVESENGTACLSKWSEAFGRSSSFKHYYLSICLILFYFPLVFMTIIYTIIISKLRSRKVPGKQSGSVREKRWKRERHVLRMSIAIVFAYAVCFVPKTLTGVLIHYKISETTSLSSCGFITLRFTSSLLSNSYCSINPCICFTFSGNYRQAMRNLLSCFVTKSKAT